MELTSKQKIDAALGIGDGQSIDDFLNGLSIDNTDKLSTSFESIGEEIKTSINEIDKTIESSGENASILELKNLDLSMKEVEDLIGTAKQLFRHTYEQIITTSLVDAELVSAVSKLLESIHINIAEFINLYKDRQKYVDKIRLKVIDHQHKMELLRLKYELESQKGKEDAVDVSEDVSIYSYDAIIERLNKLEDNTEKAED